jgi:hypothetical protein
MFLSRKNLDESVSRHFRDEQSANANTARLHLLSKSMTVNIDVLEFDVEFKHLFV